MGSFVRSQFVLGFIVASLSSFAFSSHAEAKACSSEVRSNLLQSLHALANDPKQPSDNRKNAEFAMEVIRTTMQVGCKLAPFQRDGVRVDLNTNAHQLTVFIFEQKIVALDVKSKRMH